MKRVVCFFFVCLLTLSLFGCNQGNHPPENTVAVYCKRAVPTYGTADSIIAATYLETDGHSDNYSYLLGKYLQIAPSEEFVSPFPTGTSLIQFRLEGLTAKIVLSDQFAALSGMDLTIACTCLAQTVMSLADCQEVIISANTSQLDGRNFITLNRDSYLLLDRSGISNSQ
ncbi:MAG: hypothetical protein E7462_00980 [Ruminococcaceae bacterium]|nr:hypothetical protein [Oscillospiraceae bacterium]